MLECWIDTPLDGMETPLYFFPKTDKARSALPLSVGAASCLDTGDY